ncbi:MAG: hypothetical protein WA152_00380 [Microgenomates group bacterium]
MILELIINILGIVILLRGVWGILSYFSGRGAKYYHFLSDENLKKDLPWLSWLKKYFIYRSSLYWVGTKNHATKSERFYLLILSLLQIVASLLILYTYI